MFTCGICGNLQKAGVKATKVVMEKRKKFYPAQELPKQKSDRFESEDSEGGYRKEETRYGNAGQGWEIVKEVAVCPKCAASAPEPKTVQ
jgi:rubredoxin